MSKNVLNPALNKKIKYKKIKNVRDEIIKNIKKSITMIDT